MEDSLIVVAVIAVMAGPVLAIIALVVASQARGEIQEQRRKVAMLQELINALHGQLSRRPPALPVEEVQPTSPPEPSVAPPPRLTPPIPEPSRIPAPAPAPAFQTYSPPEPRPAATETEMANLEADIGKRWITWAGAVVLFFAVSFFVKYALDNHWLGPTGRVALGILFGSALLVAGDHFLRRQWRPLGQGLVGGGLAIIYVSLFSAFSLYHLIPAPAAFTSMVLLTACGMTLAVLHDALAIGFLAVLGGFLTPVMVSTGVNARDVLMSYLVLLDLGVVAVAVFKRWRALDILAFAGSWVLFAGWFNEYYTSAQLAPTTIWVCVLYLIFIILPFVNHLRTATPVTAERFVLALVNSTVAFGFAYHILQQDYEFTLGFVTLGMSAISLGMGALTRRRITTDATSLFGFIAMAVVFLTLAIPLQIKAYGMTIAWALEGPALLYLGYRFRYFPVRVAGFLALILAVIRLFVEHWPMHHAAFTPILNSAFAGAIAIPLIIAAYAYIHQLWREQATSEDRTLKLLAGVGAGLIGLFIFQAEMGLWLKYLGERDLADYVTAVIWALGGLGFVLAGTRLQKPVISGIGLVPMVIGAILCAASYDNAQDYALVANPRFGAMAFIAFIFFVSWHQVKQRLAADEFGQVLFVLAEIVLFLTISLESYTWGSSSEQYQTARWLAQMSLTLSWGLYASVLLTVGFWRRSRGMRLTALGLFGVISLKLLLIDMSTVEQIYRIASFFVLGVLMIGASYLYHRVEKRLESTEK